MSSSNSSLLLVKLCKGVATWQISAFLITTQTYLIQKHRCQTDWATIIDSNDIQK